MVTTTSKVTARATPIVIAIVTVIAIVIVIATVIVIAMMIARTDIHTSKLI